MITIRTETGTVTFHGPQAERNRATFEAEVAAGEARAAARAARTAPVQLALFGASS